MVISGSRGAIIHADGNTDGFDLKVVTRTNDTFGRELTRINLHDPAYPLTVTLNFRADRERDVVEQWTEIVHHESGPITLERMASTALPGSATNVYLTHFFGDWAAENVVPITEQIRPAPRFWIPRLACGRINSGNPSFVLSLDGPPVENSGRVLAGSLEWSGSFQCAFDDNGCCVRAKLCAA